MKFNFKMSNINVAGVQIEGEMEVSAEMTLNELIGLRKESEHILENVPTYLNQLAEGYRTFVKLDKEFSTEEYVREESYSNIVKDIPKDKIYHAKKDNK